MGYLIRIRETVCFFITTHLKDDVNLATLVSLKQFWIVMGVNFCKF